MVSIYFLWEELLVLDSCLRFLRYLQFESATLRGPLMSDVSQLLPLAWHSAFRPQPITITGYMYTCKAVYLSKVNQL